MSTVPLNYYDSLSLVPFFEKKDHYADLPRYATRTFNSIAAENYVADSNSVSFDLLPITGQLSLWENGGLEVEPTIAPLVGANVFADQPALAWKDNITSLIRGYIVQAEDGSKIFSEEFTEANQLARALHTVTEQEASWFQSNGSNLMVAKDRPMPGVISGLVDANSIKNPRLAKYTGAPAAASNADNPLLNLGFAERRAALLNSVIKADNTLPGAADFNTAAGFKAKAMIPLRALSSFWKAFGESPIMNMRLRIIFLLNTTASASGYAPLTRGTRESGTVENAYTLSVATAPRLHFETVTFNEAENVKFQTMLRGEGFVQRLRFTESQVFKMRIPANAGAYTNTITTNVKDPLRLFVLAYPRLGANDPPAYTADSWPGSCVTGATGFASLNLAVDSQQYFASAQVSLPAQYLAFRSQMNVGLSQDTSGVISYNDWLRTYRINVLDISRTGPVGRSFDRSKPVSLELQATVAGANEVDVAVVLQKQRVFDLKFGAGELQVVDSTVRMA